MKKVVVLFLAILMVSLLASSAFSGDVSITVIKKGAKPSGCLLKQPAINIFPKTSVSPSQTYSTVYICSEASCGDIEAEFGGVLHDSYLGCDNNLSYDNVSPNSYSFYAQSTNCNTNWEYELLVEEGYDYIIWLCPPEGVVCCNQGCAEDGSFNCDACSGGCYAAYVTKDRTVLANLRQFRNYMAKNIIGQKVVTEYYKLSPTAIKVAKKFPFIKEMSKKFLGEIAK